MESSDSTLAGRPLGLGGERLASRQHFGGEERPAVHSSHSWGSAGTNEHESVCLSRCAFGGGVRVSCESRKRDQLSEAPLFCFTGGNARNRGAMPALRLRFVQSRAGKSRNHRYLRP